MKMLASFKLVFYTSININFKLQFTKIHNAEAGDGIFARNKLRIQSFPK